MSSLCCRSISPRVISQTHVASDFEISQARLGAQRNSLLTSIVNYSSTTSPQFGPRWYKSYPGHNEEDFQHKQQEVHDLSPVFAID
jgi:hypothetical protein